MRNTGNWIGETKKDQTVMTITKTEFFRVLVKLKIKITERLQIIYKWWKRVSLMQYLIL